MKNPMDVNNAAKPSGVTDPFVNITQFMMRKSLINVSSVVKASDGIGPFKYMK